MRSKSEIFVGLMSGTSVDGVDAVVADFSSGMPRVLGRQATPFTPALRARLLALAESQPGEVDLACKAGLELAGIYASSTAAALDAAGLDSASVRAIGCHGQTIRHCPEKGYTVQIGAAAELAEQTGITVVADFRSADIAAGGQGAPLAPGFHAAFLAAPAQTRVILNLGGISNLTRLAPGLPVIGFDCGPANILLDGWIGRHRGEAFDRDGAWATSGRIIQPLLDRMLIEPYFALPFPKSTGRDLFNIGWVDRHLDGNEAAVDVQATLLAVTVESIARAIQVSCEGQLDLVVCGGGAHNRAMLAALAQRCPPARVRLSSEFGIEPESVEPLAFAWLARERLAGRPGNLPEVTGARGPRVLGAIYPAYPAPARVRTAARTN